MLRVYYGRESADKEAFLFQEIEKELAALRDERDEGGRIFLLVPDQYTLQAERNAFAHLDIPGMMDLEVLSQSRLGTRILEETGGAARVYIDRQGKHMLLSAILSEEREELTAFRGLSGSHSFIEMASDLISEMKQYNADPEDLTEVISGLSDNPLLAGKLKDIQRIYQRYQERIEGKYVDTEAYMQLFASKVKESRMVKEGVFWISGFFSFTPKALAVLEELAVFSRGVNVVLTCGRELEEEGGLGERDEDLFVLSRRVVRDLRALAGRRGVPFQACGLTDAAGTPGKAPEIRHVERELYACPLRAFAGGDAPGQRESLGVDGDGLPGAGGQAAALRLLWAANFYGEAETAAAEIARLVREEGMRYREIAVILNDMEGRGAIARRIFNEYQIPIFADVKRSILHNPAVTLILSLLDVVTGGWQYEDVFLMLKTGFFPIEQEDCEDLENYAVKYKIKGKRWKSEFRYGSMELGEEELSRLSGLRGELVRILLPLEEAFEKARTVEEKTRSLYYYLRDDLGVPDQLEERRDRLAEGGDFEAAEETAQVWEIVVNLLDQMIELAGGETISEEPYASMMKAGFEAVEVGLIPPSADQVVMGTMQRTRLGRIKALLVLGANDGILPAAGSGQALLNEDERALLLGKRHVICRDDTLMAMEERLSIYKNLSAPLKYLWVGCSAADGEGKEIRPSVIFEKLRELFPRIPVEKDLLNRNDPLSLIQGKGSTLKHLTLALQREVTGEEELSREWTAAASWYLKEEPEALKPIMKGLFFRNEDEKLERSLVRKLFQKDGVSQAEWILSPSRLERFSRCPFSHLVQYGLRPEERRVFEVAGREVGDVYHECLMRLSEELTVPGLAITDPLSPWMTLTREECARKIGRIVEEVAAGYREGMLQSGQEEQYRTRRMKGVCGRAAWALVSHVQKGKINRVYFEEPFGDGKDKAFPAVRVPVGEDAFRIEGKIDRVDVLPGDYVKVIDYKSGRERFDLAEARGGWRLQLMLYLKAALAGVQGKEGEAQVKPAGVFYFEIADPLIDADSIDRRKLEEGILQELTRSFKLDGVILNQPEVIEGIAGEFSGYSEILPLRKNKDGLISATAENRLLDEESFSALREEMDRTVERLCERLAGGAIEARPKKTKNETACRYCQYKNICNFDPLFEGCEYEVVK